MIGCTNGIPKEFDLNQLTRVDVVEKNDGSNNKEIVISDEETLRSLREVFGKIMWEPNTKVKMIRKEDVKILLFYTFDKNMPERLFKYRIWFNKNNTAKIISATIISNDEREGYGTLDKHSAIILENILLN